MEMSSSEERESMLVRGREFVSKSAKMLLLDMMVCLVIVNQKCLLKCQVHLLQQQCHQLLSIYSLLVIITCLLVST